MCVCGLCVYDVYAYGVCVCICVCSQHIYGGHRTLCRTVGPGNHVQVIRLTGSTFTAEPSHQHIKGQAIFILIELIFINILKITLLLSPSFPSHNKTHEL